MEEKKEDFIYCQAEIEYEGKCATQCEHCKQYYAPLEKQWKEEQAQKELTKEIRDNFH